MTTDNRTITILVSSWGEYRVPGPKGTEAQAYYTDDREDALSTAQAIFGQGVRVKVKRTDWEG